MSSEEALQALLKHPRIWRSGHASLAGRNVVSTGFPMLDERLGGGWPGGVLTELLHDGQGLGELRLLLPALKAGHELICCVAPPCIPYAPALVQHGIELSRLLIVRSRQSVDTLWAAEQALRSAACSTVLLWLSDDNDRGLRRLQLAAESGVSCAVLFRPARLLRASSPAPLRIHLVATAAGLQLQFVRNRYGSCAVLTLSC